MLEMIMKKGVRQPLTHSPKQSDVGQPITVDYI